MPVPFLDLTAQYKQFEAEWLAAIRETGNRGSFVLGPNTQAFEKECAEYVGVKHAIGVANGTDSLYLSLRALGIGPGDEVITTPFTFFASAESIDMVGATPVFADILPDSFCLDPASIRKKITSKTRKPSCRCIFSAIRRRWTKSWRSPNSTSLPWSKTAPRRSAPPRRQGRRRHRRYRQLQLLPDQGARLLRRRRHGHDQ